jgi:hypothetical protein
VIRGGGVQAIKGAALISIPNCSHSTHNCSVYEIVAICPYLL